MSKFFNSFLNNLGQGLTRPKGNLGDFQHAARLYNSQAFRLAPKQKFLYHCVFNINPDAIRSTSFDVQRSVVAINMLVKAVDLPKFKVQVDAVHQYNKKRQVQTRLDYDPIQVTFHDDNQGLTTALWSLYYGYYFADSSHGGSAGASPSTASSGLAGFLGGVIPGISNLLGQPKNTTGSASPAIPAAYYKNSYKGAEYNKFRYGLDNYSSKPFFTSIQIFQLSRKQYQAYTLINPIITSWSHDSLENSDGAGTTANTMTIAYEAVFYGTGAISQGNPSGFATDYYDKSPSPLTLLGGGTRSLFGQGGVLAGITDVFGDVASGKAFSDPRAFLGTLIKGANTVANAKQLSREGLRQEGFGIIKGTLNAVTGVNVSGVANTVFPKSGGNGQNVTTKGIAPKESVNRSPLTARNQQLITSTPGAVDSLTRLAISAGLVAGGSDASAQAVSLLDSGNNASFNNLANKVANRLKG
jgi:hypothetical protein